MLKITLDRYFQNVEILIKTIKPYRERYDMILAISRGGTIVGTYLSHALDIPMGVIVAKSYGKDHSQQDVQLSSIAMTDDIPLVTNRWLIVEDLVDTGRTLEAIIKKFPEKQFDIGALFHKGKCINPDFSVECLNEWIVFPYEDFC